MSLPLYAVKALGTAARATPESWNLAIHHHWVGILHREDAAGAANLCTLPAPFRSTAIEGGGFAGRDGAWTNVALDFPAGDREWIARDLVVTVGRREH